MDAIEIPDLELKDWLDELKPYQRNALRQLLEFSDSEGVAKKWISASGPDNTISFGGVRDTEPFWDKFKGEFRKFICDEESYAAEKKALKAEGPVTKTLLISGVSSAIGATIGFSATLLAPAVVLLLYTVGKIGKNAYCSND